MREFLGTWKNFINEFSNMKVGEVWYFKVDNLLASHGIRRSIQLSYLKRVGGQAIDITTGHGGGFVFFPGNYVIGQKINNMDDEQFGQRIIAFMTIQLQLQNLKAFIDHNDILIESNNQIYKVGSYTNFEYNNCYICGFSISLNINTKWIEGICNDPTYKIPRGLDHWGITEDNIRQWLLDFAKKYKY